MKVLSCAVAMLAVALCDFARARDLVWINPAGGFFETGANWDTAIPPTVGDTVLFDLSSPGYAVSFASSALTSGLRVGDDSLALILNGNTWTLDATAEPSIELGMLPGDFADVTLFGGSLAVQSVEIGVAADSIGSLTLSGGAAHLSTGGLLSVGAGGTGILQLSGGATVSASAMMVGEHADSTGIVGVSGVGSALDIAGPLFVAGAGDGFIDVGPVGTLITRGETLISDFAQRSGNISVFGTNAVWNAHGDVSIGASGDAHVSVGSGGQVVVDGAVRLVGGPGVQPSTLTIDSGGTVAAASLDVGAVGIANELHMVGPDASLTLAKGVTVGNLMGQTEVSLVNGASVVNHGDVTINGSNASALRTRVTLSGAGTQWDCLGTLTFTKHEPLIVENGALLTAGNMVHRGNTTITGDGAQVIVAGAFEAPNHSNITVDDGGQLNVKGPATLATVWGARVSLTSSDWVLNAALFESSLTTATTVNSTADITGYFTVLGQFLFVDHGRGMLKIARAKAGSFKTTQQPDSVCSVSVEGGFTCLGDATIGVAGHTYIELESGKFDCDGNLTFADAASSHVSMDDYHGYYHVGGTDVWIGRGGRVEGGLLHLQAYNATVHLAEGASSDVDIEVLLAINTKNVVAGEGSLRVLLTEGRYITAGDVILRAGNLLRGDGTVLAVFGFQQNGITSPGDDGVGTFHVEGHFINSSTSELRIEVGPSHLETRNDRLEVDPGQFNLGADVHLDGTLRVEPLPGVQINVGEAFEIIHTNGGTVLGGFASLEGPGEYDVTYNSGSVVITYTLAPILGDLNEDNVVNVLDLLLLLGGWGECHHSDPCPADLNLDETVNVQDLLLVLMNWG